MKKKKNAFTLIELLAIIVILAIIAVITVPIILNIIENAKVGAAKNSAYGYKDAVDKYYVSQLSDNENFRLDGEYDVLNGNLKGEYLPAAGVNIPVSGTVPTNGTLQYENSKFKNGCLTMGDYAVTFNSDGTTKTEKGECSASSFASIPYSFTRTVNGVAYASAKKIKENPVYYNPTNGTFCTIAEYEENNPTPETGAYKKSGCMKWYAYSKNSDGTINLLLDHNTTASVAWIANETDYQDGTSVGITYPEDYTLPNWSYGSEEWQKGVNYSGPVTALKQLKIDTDSWSNSLIRNDSYSVNLTINSYENNSNVERPINYTINYNNYKARLISAEEVLQIANISTNISEAHDGMYFNTDNWLSDNKYSWLYNYAGNCKLWNPQCDVGTNSDNSNGGYYTSTASNGKERMWYVREYGGLSDEGGVEMTWIGIRPVITIRTSIAEESETSSEQLAGLCTGAVNRMAKGSTLTIANETFYVLNSNECTTTLIAAENISPTTGKQDGDVRTEEVFAMDIPQLYGNNPYPYVYNSSSNYYNFVNNYKNYLNNNSSFDIITARLASYEELASVGCSTSNNSCPSWIRNTKFYLGSSDGYAYGRNLWYVDSSSGKLLTQGPSYVNMGIRPVILIPTGEIE